jgi:hypothetical protein
VGVDETHSGEVLAEKHVFVRWWPVCEKKFLYYRNFHDLSFFKVGIAPGDKYARLTSSNVSQTLL